MSEILVPVLLADVKHINTILGRICSVVAIDSVVFVRVSAEEADVLACGGI